jgi:hypothetical protein
MNSRLRIIFFYAVVIMFAFERCAYNDVNVPINCDESSLAIGLQSKTDVTSCRSIDGSISVTATGGTEPYDFNINGGEYQTNNTFTNLGPGDYTIRVKDMNNCWRAIEVSITAPGSTLDASTVATVDNQCSTDNGTIVVTATGGKTPYQFQVDSKGFSASSTFTGLKEGQHVVIVKDDEGCQRTLGVTIAHGNTGTSYANQVKAIITANCALSGCHDAGTGSRNWTTFANVKSNAANIKARVVNRTMPPAAPLSQANIDLISCWVDDGALEN